jgi:hypothetical protein
MTARRIHKKAGERRPHQRHRKGCAIYAKRTFCCQMWNCRLPVNDDKHDLPRSDRAQHVIDLMPDFITIRNDDTGELQQVQVVQIWIDPHRPEAHRDPALRRYLERRAANGTAALVRFDSHKALTIFTPALSQDCQRHEIASGMSDKEQRPDVERALGGRARLVFGER